MTAAALEPALESLLAFWAEAGVDAAVEDAPIDKLKRREPERPAPPPKPPAIAAAPVGRTSSGGETAELAQAARGAAAAAQDLPALQAAVEALELGSLRPPSAPIAFLRADDAVDIAVLGGAPGEAEARERIAFAGAEGRLLDRMLASVGLNGRALRLHAGFWPKAVGEAPSPEELEIVRPFVDRALALSRPRALLVLGDQPARAWLQRTEGFLKLRGQALDYRPEAAGAALPVVVTFHPGLLLRQPMAKKQAWKDLLTLGDRVAEAKDAP